MYIDTQDCESLDEVAPQKVTKKRQNFFPKSVDIPGIICYIIGVLRDRKQKRKGENKMYGYYEKGLGHVSEEKFNSWEEIEQWATDTFGYWDPDYLFALDADEVED